MIIDSVGLLSEISDINSVERCRDFLSSLVKELGANCFWYMAGDLSAKVFHKIHDIKMVINSYPKEFVENYIQNKRFRHDPVVTNSLKMRDGSMCWDELFQKSFLKDAQLSQLEWASQYDIVDGVSSVISCGDSFSLLHFALDSKRELEEGFLRKLKLILFTVNYLISEKELKREGNKRLENVRFSLSARESECLLWAAKGKTIWETGVILGLSENTIREYLANAMKKLSANNKVEAVAKAVIYKKIELFDLFQYFNSSF